MKCELTKYIYITYTSFEKYFLTGNGINILCQNGDTSTSQGFFLHQPKSSPVLVEKKGWVSLPP